MTSLLLINFCHNFAPKHKCQNNIWKRKILLSLAHQLSLPYFLTACANMCVFEWLFDRSTKISPTYIIWVSNGFENTVSDFKRWQQLLDSVVGRASFCDCPQIGAAPRLLTANSVPRQREGSKIMQTFLMCSFQVYCQKQENSWRSQDGDPHFLLCCVGQAHREKLSLFGLPKCNDGWQTSTNLFFFSPTSSFIKNA